MSRVAPHSTTPHAAKVIAVVEPSLVGLLDKVAPEVEAGRVSSLVVDDTSGRPIGLFLHRSLELLGHKLPIIFVCPPGPGEEGKREVASLTPHQVALLGDAPLVVTEVIYSGEATGSIVRALNQVGRVPAIASLSGFLVRDESERGEMMLVTSRSGRDPSGEFSEIVMPEKLSYAAQDILCADKVLSGVIREDAASTKVYPTATVHPTDLVRREVRAFRKELYRVAAEATRDRTAGGPAEE